MGVKHCPACASNELVTNGANLRCTACGWVSDDFADLVALGPAYHQAVAKKPASRKAPVAGQSVLFVDYYNRRGVPAKASITRVGRYYAHTTLGVKMRLDTWASASASSPGHFYPSEVELEAAKACDSALAIMRDLSSAYPTPPGLRGVPATVALDILTAVNRLLGGKEVRK